MSVIDVWFFILLVVTSLSLINLAKATHKAKLANEQFQVNPKITINTIIDSAL